MEKPTEYLLKALKRAERDHKVGQVSPTFDNAKDAIAWLHKSTRRRHQKPSLSLVSSRA